jgi:hypothetical protein
MLQGWGYEITGADVFAAYDYAMTSAEKIGKEKQVRRDIINLVENDKSPGTFVKGILERYLRQ